MTGSYHHCSHRIRVSCLPQYQRKHVEAPIRLDYMLLLCCIPFEGCANFSIFLNLRAVMYVVGFMFL